MSDMERFSDYQEGERPEGIRFKIVVPTANDAEQVRKALEYLHYADIDTDLVPVNALVHGYLVDPFVPPTICVNETEYERLCEMARLEASG